MGAHRSLGEFSIENVNKNQDYEKYILGDTAIVNDSVKSVNSVVDSDYKGGIKKNDGLQDENQESTKKDVSIYTFADLLAVVFSYLFFCITSSYLNKVILSDVYKQRGSVALLCICVIVNCYYLLRPFFIKHKSVLSKISFITVSSIIISGIYSAVSLSVYDLPSDVFRNFFFLGSILFVFDYICFSAGIEKIKDDLNIEKEYINSDGYINIASTSSLQSASLQKKPLRELKRNDLVYLKMSDILPFDGEVVDGEAIVSKRIYAGETEASILTKKVYAFAGSKILNGELIVRVDNLWEDTFIYDNIVKCQNSINENQKIFGRNEIALFIIACFVSFAVNFIFFSKLTVNSLVLFFLSCGALFSFFKTLIIKNAFSGFILKRAFSDNILINKRKVLDKFLSIKNFIFDFSNNAFSKDFYVDSFKLYDERIDESYLLEALFSVFAKSDAQVFKKLNLFIAKKQKIVKAYKLDDYMEYSDCNIVAYLSNTRFVVGEESFMIEMKVQAQESDFVEDNQRQRGQKVLYVALNDMIVGNFTLTEEFIPAMKYFVSKVKECQSNFYLTSMEREALVDDIGKNSNVSIANIFGGLSIKNYIDKINSIGENIFFSNLNTNKQIMRAINHNVGVFDPVICETKNFDIVVFGNNLASFGKVVSYIVSLKKFLANFSIYSMISLLILAALSFNPIYLMLAIMILSNGFLNLFRFKTSKF